MCDGVCRWFCTYIDQKGIDPDTGEEKLLWCPFMGLVLIKSQSERFPIEAILEIYKKREIKRRNMSRVDRKCKLKF